MVGAVLPILTVPEAPESRNAVPLPLAWRVRLVLVPPLVTLTAPAPVKLGEMKEVFAVPLPLMMKLAVWGEAFWLSMKDPLSPGEAIIQAVPFHIRVMLVAGAMVVLYIVKAALPLKELT
jgi:hypothetical protein